MHCFYGWLAYLVVYIIILSRLMLLIWDWFSRISIYFFIHSDSALILQSFLFTNSWSNLRWCIVRCFFWWTSIAVRWVFWFLTSAIYIQGLISVSAAIFSMFSYFKFFCWLLIVARFILTFKKHFDNYSFSFFFFYQKFILFLKNFYNFFIVLLFQLAWNVGNAFL